MNATHVVTLFCVACGAAALGPRTARAAEDAALAELRGSLEAVLQQNQALQRWVEALESEVESARDEARAARELAARPPAAVGGSGTPDGYAPLGSFGRLQLMDVSMDVLSSVGGSSVRNEEIESLQGGGHDPHQRGFNLQNVELSLQGAVDPWLDGEVHLIYFLDAEGESQFEVEEAFATTRMLPFGLEEHGLQLEFGHFLTEFGRINPTHPHAWHWQDQPIVNTRFFGADGMRAPGARLGWLVPLPWFSELHLGAQNPQGETMASFLASDEAFEERPVGGRPFVERDVRGLEDFVYLARWVNGFDLSDTVTAQLGLSGVTGPNATGPDGRTWIYGTDLVVKWRPLSTDKGWPFVVFESELMGRSYEADSFFGCTGLGEDEACEDPLALGSDTLDDWGGYAQLLYGFRRGWAAGLRYEYATGSGASVEAFEDRAADPFRGDRHRVSPLIAWYPSEFSRVRLQYNYDRADFLEDADHAHSVWLGLEFLFGSHPAHRF
jgi:hypothetical protein